ncbi:MAG: acetyl-CoA carboxylase biotin carboxyl carrier protein [Methylobacteriaceae bacterium]|nr:acetyl-CoA carboxylase biotin carboxyl carrier protein [Methylobacteriaceae bacterium]
MSQADLTQKDIEHIIDIIKAASDVADFSLKYGTTEIHISREGRGNGASPVAPVLAPAPQPPSATPTSSSPAAAIAAPAPPAPQSKTHNEVSLGASEFTVDAPMVGTFYRAPAPGEAPFVDVGQAVEADTVLCIIEVMKLMNSIAARRKGRVKRILVEDGEPVEFGQALIVLEADD